MLGPGHSLIGASAGALTAQQLGAHPLAGAVVGGLVGKVPDWDRYLPGHRGWTHAPVTAVAVGLLLALWNPLLGVLVAAGLFSHILADSVTEAGIPWAYPFSRKRAALPRWVAFKTGGPVEWLVVVGVVGATLWWVADLGKNL